MKKGETLRPETYDVSKDVIRLADTEGSLSADKIFVHEDGQLTYGDSFDSGKAKNGVVDLSAAETGGVFTARLADKNGQNKQLVAWSGSKGGTLDLRSETKGAVMKDGGNRERDNKQAGDWQQVNQPQGQA